MLATVIHVRTFSTSPVSFVGEFPRQLLECAADSRTENISNLGRCPLDGCDALCLQVALLCKQQRILLLDCPAKFCRNSKRLILSDSTQVSSRLARVSRGPLGSLAERKDGIAAALERPLVSADVAAVAGGGTMSYSPGAHAIVFGDCHPGPLQDCLPDAVVFHSIALPDTLTVKVEPNTHCNFNCGFCYGRHMPQANMSLHTLSRVLDNIPNLRAIELTGEGEPLVHSRIFDLIAECKRRSLWTHITSNGSLFTDARLKRLFDLGLDSLAVSLESIQPERFARLRPGGNLETVRAGISNASRIKEAGGYKVCLRLWITILRETIQELKDIRRFADDAGIDIVEFQMLNPKANYTRFYSPELKANVMTTAEVREIIASKETPPEAVAMLAEAIAPAAGQSCDVFMNMVMANVTGGYLPCCLLKAQDFPVFGNLASETIEHLWGSPRFERFRFALQHGIVVESCADCINVASAYGQVSGA